MKTAVVSTYCDWNSYGSILQSIGLQSALASIGVRGIVVRVEREFDRKPVRYRKNNSPANCLCNIYTYLHRKDVRHSCRKNKQFIQEQLRVQTYASDQALKQAPPDADIYIAGSDQIWNPANARGEFFLDFVPEGKHCISYAASMGRTEIPDPMRDKYQEKLARFTHISVREADMVPVIGQLTGKPVKVHIDPTFLKTADEWRALQKPCKLSRPYILVYLLYWDSRVNGQLKQLKKQTGFDIVSIHSGLRNIYADHVIRDADAGEFLWLVDHAEYVVTSSFHGVAFSTIFNKQYSAILNPNAPSRIKNLLEVLDIKTPNIKDCGTEFEVDYTAVNRRIQAEQERSLSYLRGEIFGET